MPELVSHPIVSTSQEIASVCQAASQAAQPYAALPARDRARFLDRIAQQLECLGEALLQTANRETSLPLARLTGERSRACAQLRMFGALIRHDAWLDVRIEPGDPARHPVAKLDLRRTQIPLGPVAVFAASNFPFAFSVPGGDTASALAAGCPVVVKAHPGHPETSRLAAEAILRAARDCGVPEGTFGIVWGGPETGRALALDNNVYAVGFTGSLRAGRTLFDLAAGRRRPIPVYAEMGSVNPLFVLPGALVARGEALAQGYSDSLSLGAGQFCTNPGVLVGLEGLAFETLIDNVAERLKRIDPSPMLYDGICDAYVAGIGRLYEDRRLVCHFASDGTAAALFSVDAATFLSDPILREELFGPAAIAVRCVNLDQMRQVAEVLEGQLTATVHFEDSDVEAVRMLLPNLVRMAGRIVANGFPTGVEVSPAMQHGGPFPATTDSRSTSVGTAAILRFVRPVAFQDFPSSMLPTELRYGELAEFPA